MKKYLFIIAFVILSSCSAPKNTTTTEKSTILVGYEAGGAAFKFYEIIDEPDEFEMLLNDDQIKKYVKKTDIETCNFILVNLGRLNSEGYRIKVKKVEELSNKVLVTIEEIEPANKNNLETRPYFVVKINSKKPIEITK